MSLALELWRVLEAWDEKAKRYRIDKGLPGAGRFMPGTGSPGGSSKRPSLADAVRGTAEGGPKRQRGDKAGMSVADAVRKAARTSDTTGRPTRHTDAEHRAHGAHDVADEVERALDEAGAPDWVRKVVTERSRARADSHGPRPDTLKSAKAPAPAVSDAEVPQQRVAAAKADVRSAVGRLQTGPGEWVGLARLRDDLGEKHNRHVVDDALKDLEREPDVNIVPESNRKTLTAADHDSAVRIGNQDKHLIAIDSKIGGGTAAPAPASDGLDRYRTSEDDYRKHYDGFTDDQLASAGRVEGVPTEGRSRAGIVSDLAAARAREDRKVLEQNLAERQAGSGAGSVQTRPAGAGGSTERTEVTGAWKGGRSSGGSAAPAPKTRDRRAPSGGAPVARGPKEQEAEIHRAWGEVAGDGEWASIADLRDATKDTLSRDDFDEAIRRLGRGDSQAGAMVEEETNQKTLTARDRDAAVMLGGRRVDVVQFTPKSRVHFGGAEAKRAKVPTKAELDADALARQRQGGLGSGRETGKQAWGQLLSGPQKEAPKPKAARTPEQDAADRKAILDKTAAALSGGAPKRANVFANPEFNASTGRGSSGVDEARTARDDSRARLADALRTAHSRNAARSAISSLNVRELRGLAEHLGIKPGAKATKPKLLDAIVDGTAGRRLDSEALGRH